MGSQPWVSRLAIEKITAGDCHEVEGLVAIPGKSLGDVLVTQQGAAVREDSVGPTLVVAGAS
jgi:hypothetical protein